MRARRLWGRWVVPLLVAAVAVACQDLREFAGTWQGQIAADPALAHGFAASATVTADVRSAGREGVDLTFILPSGRTARFVPIRRAAGDVLADIQMPGEPLRTFLGFVQDGDQDRDPSQNGNVGDNSVGGYLAVLSLYSDTRIELRLIRGTDDAYGVFTLRRASESAKAAPVLPQPTTPAP